MSHDSQGTTVRHSLPALLARYLQRRTDEVIHGHIAAEAGEVVPFEAATLQPVDARLAWDEAQAALRCYDSAFDPRKAKPPVEWSTLVAAQEPVPALPFCAGNYPQLVRDLHTLMKTRQLSSLPATTSLRPTKLDTVEPYAREALRQKQPGRFLLAVGMLRLARQFDEAEQLLDEHHRDLPKELKAGCANERAALAWHRGKTEEARSLWLEQEPSVPVLFNRGVAALFTDRGEEAKAALVGAVDALPETCAWHQLGRLYLALAGMAK
jgi:hypothetical protein